MRIFSFRLLRISLLVATLLMMLPGCVVATVRTIKEDETAKAGFSPEDYVDEIWESRVLPTYRDEAQDFTTLLTEIETDETAAVAQYGHRSGTGAYSFMVRGEGKIVTFDTSSRTGLATIDLDGDDTPDLSLTIGPSIKISQRASVRDAVGFIEYGNFVNQQEFAGVANAMGDRIVAMLADALGAADVEAIRDLDPASVEGKTVSFIGAFSLDSIGDPVVVPVVFEVID